MKTILKILYFVFLCTSIFIKPLFANEYKDWTIMIYMCADNDLDKYSVDDMIELEQIGSTDKVNILVQIDRANNLPTRRYYVKKRLANNEADDWGLISELKYESSNINSGDYNELINFCNWVISNYKAKHYIVIIWNHGSGIKLKNFSNQFYNKGIAYDFSSKSNISTLELGKILKKINEIFNIKIDLLIMDACFMQMLEIMYEVKDHVNFICASEDIEPEFGMPYLPICEILYKYPNIKPKFLANLIVNSFYDKYVDLKIPHTYSAIDCSYIDEIVKLVNEFCKLMIELSNDQKFKEIVKNCSLNVQRFTYNDYVDLGHFISLILSNCSNVDLKFNQYDFESLKLVCEKLKLCYKKSIVNNKTFGENLQNATGIGIYLPKNYMKTNYKRLNFVINTLWDEMLFNVLDIKEGW